MKNAGIVIWLAGAIFCVAQRPSPPNIRSISPAELVSAFDQSNDAIRSNLALPQFGAFVVTNEIRYPLNVQPYAVDPRLHVVLTNGPAIRITYLTNDNKLGFQEIGPELPSGTPVEGTIITTFDRRLVPCFAAIDPPCPGHWSTNFTRWMFRGGQWNMELATNSLVMTDLHPKTKDRDVTEFVDLPGGKTNYLESKRLLYDGAEVETTHDPTGRFRAVGTNINISTGQITTKWRYEIPPLEWTVRSKSNDTTNWVKVPCTTTNNHIWYEYRIIELGLVSDGRVVWR